MRKRIFFICGSMNQTTQMHQISMYLNEYEHAFSPYYCDGLHEIFRKRGLMEFTITGDKLASRCRMYLEKHNLPKTHDFFHQNILCRITISEKGVNFRSLMVHTNLTCFNRFNFSGIHLDSANL